MLSCHKGTKSRSYTKTGFVALRVLVSLWRALLNTNEASRGSEPYRLIRCTLGDYQRDVVVLLVRAEATNVVNYRPEQDL